MHCVRAVRPELAEHASVEIRHRAERRVDTCDRVRAGYCVEGVHRDLRLGEAHLTEAADTTGDSLSVLCENGPVEAHRRRVSDVGRGQLSVYEQFVIPLGAECGSQEVGIAWRRAAPDLDPVLETELLRGLQDHQRLGRGAAQYNGAVRARGIDLAEW